MGCVEGKKRILQRVGEQAVSLIRKIVEEPLRTKLHLFDVRQRARAQAKIYQELTSAKKFDGLAVFVKYLPG